MDSNWVSAALTVLRWAAFIICFWLVQLKHTTGSWSSFVEMSKSIPTLITRSRGWVESGRRAASRSAQSQSQLELRVCSRLHLSLTFLSPTLLIVFLVRIKTAIIDFLYVLLYIKVLIYSRDTCFLGSYFNIELSTPLNTVRQHFNKSHLLLASASEGHA